MVFWRGWGIMKKTVICFVLFGMLVGICSPLFAQQAAAPAPVQELIRVNVKNEFDEQIQVQFDGGRKIPVGPNEKIILGERKPGKYTLTIYNKKGDFIDNLTRKIEPGKEEKNSYKYTLNDQTVSNSDKITGLSTGQKVAITAGALGAAGLGAVLVNKALNMDEAQQEQYIPPAPVPQLQPQVAQNPLLPADQPVAQDTGSVDNAFAPGGKTLKFLNIAYPNVTLIVQGTDGNPIGNNWVIPKALSTQKARPLIYSGENVTINPDQKIKVLLPNGLEVQRYAFELETDPLDSNSYIWTVK